MLVFQWAFWFVPLSQETLQIKCRLSTTRTFEAHSLPLFEFFGKKSIFSFLNNLNSPNVQINWGESTSGRTAYFAAAERDATVAVHKDFLRSELLAAPYLVQNTKCEIFESPPGFPSQYARDISRINSQMGMLWPFFLRIYKFSSPWTRQDFA